MIGDALAGGGDVYASDEEIHEALPSESNRIDISATRPLVFGKITTK
jgi:hypothetical protein